jgi:peptidoglycan/LPS O-acetylase OafA/YrhL
VVGAKIAHGGFGVAQATQYRADSLFVGCALALVLPELERYLRAWMALPLLAGVLACMPIYVDPVPLHESIAIALLLAVTSQCPSRFTALLDWKPLAFLGAISYSVYVWQEPFTLLPHPSLLVVSGLLALLAAFAAGSYYLLEKPARAFGRRLATPSTCP